MGQSGEESKKRGKRMREEAPAQEPFEAQLEELDRIVTLLEDGKLPLDEALTLYERGMRLAQACQERLDTAELRVRQLRLAHGPSGEADAGDQDFLLDTVEIEIE